MAISRSGAWSWRLPCGPIGGHVEFQCLTLQAEARTVAARIAIPVRAERGDSIMNTSLRFVMALGLVSLSVACGGGDTEERAGAQPDTSQAAAADTGMQGMPGMGGMQRGGMMEMMTQMQSQLQMMQGMSADSMHALLPQHRQMAANMLALMNREMQGMNMAGDTAWNATVDSLRRDLTRMPAMSAQELHAFMPEHNRRVMALMEMHRTMMGRM
jgi:hypothetical protein